jgi:hypothetical protein
LYDNTGCRFTSSKSTNPNPIEELKKSKSLNKKSKSCAVKSINENHQDPTAARFELRLYENQMTSVPCEKDNTDQKPQSIEVIITPERSGVF